MAKKKTETDEVRRVRHLVALDAAQVMQRLTAHADEMVHLFSKTRSRDPLLRATEALFFSIGFSSLSQLPVVEQQAASRFFEQLRELRWYFSYTEDMPGSLREKFEHRLTQLQALHRELTSIIGPADAHGVRVVQVTRQTRTALKKP